MKKLLLTSIAALFLATGAVHAETNVLGCFVRVYDKAHLAKHPDQWPAPGSEDTKLGVLMELEVGHGET